MVFLMISAVKNGPLADHKENPIFAPLIICDYLGNMSSLDLVS